MPLTHVCIWSGHGWKRITAFEAARMRPGGTVSARSGLFMCDICGQYVTLTNGDIRVPYFKHSSEEKSKDCPERTFGLATTYEFKADLHNLPIRIRIIDYKSFEIEIGFIDIPDSILGKRDSRKIVIKQIGANRESYVYSLERLNKGTITYLSVGRIPAERYQITYTFESTKIASYWPSFIAGLSSDGSLFDTVSRKKLPEDADVVINHPYYLVTTHQKSWLHGYKNIRINQICHTINGRYNNWYVYEVEANSYGEDSARFFLDYHARLTEKPVDLFPIWPEYIEKPYRIFHRYQNIWLYMRGEGVKSKVFPSTTTRIYQQNDCNYYISLRCNERQQLVSTGRVKVLKYMYLWKDDLAFTHANQQKAEVKNSEGELLNEGEYNELPSNGILHVKLKVDGTVEIEDTDGFIILKRAITAGQDVRIDGLHFNSTLRIFCGLDCIWLASFKRKILAITDSIDDQKLIFQLERYKGDMIPIGHALGGVISSLEGRDNLKKWIIQQIHNGEISRRALRVLTTVLGGYPK